MIDVSIIIPMYNAATTVSKLLDSILNQETTFSYEVICVDDGSTDGTVDVLQTYADDYTNIRIVGQKNSKQAAARNNGLKNALGKYVMFADADDYWAPNFFESVYDQLQSNTELLIFGIIKRYASKDIIERSSALEASRSQRDLIKNYLVNNLEMDVGVWNKIFVKKIIDDYNLKFMNGNFFEDSIFVFDYLTSISYKQIVYVDKAYYVLNKHNATTTNHFAPEITDRAFAYYTKIKDKLQQTELRDKTSLKAILVALKVRLLLHVSHHFMMYNKRWSPKMTKKLLKDKGPKLSIVVSNQYLSIKYKISWVLLRWFPVVYRALYKRYKPTLS
ncbi:glycosyltransferase family 2 protein [Lactiplantibacillus pentosus]|uniref:glycosyltransferase family 2 protein n=1 Tax=Lactiplantibacillus pentosus TaxID=1589 RepID=UPI0021821D50|nr:glycosyltransferase family 2 protein [Lactiplantibacillus pentosus]MCT0162161.1 glycosyltransferase family 2 protein [Lactiplantibacillus pentosus]